MRVVGMQVGTGVTVVVERDVTVVVEVVGPGVVVTVEVLVVVSVDVDVREVRVVEVLVGETVLVRGMIMMGKAPDCVLTDTVVVVIRGSGIIMAAWLPPIHSANSSSNLPDDASMATGLFFLLHTTTAALHTHVRLQLRAGPKIVTKCLIWAGEWDLPKIEGGGDWPTAVYCIAHCRRFMK